MERAAHDLDPAAVNVHVELHDHVEHLDHVEHHDHVRVQDRNLVVAVQDRTRKVVLDQDQGQDHDLAPDHRHDLDRVAVHTVDQLGRIATVVQDQAVDPTNSIFPNAACNLTIFFFQLYIDFMK